MYVIYLTAYRGNKLPPFYIGSTSLKRLQAGYVGSVASRRYSKIWEQERKQNPQLFSTKVISTRPTRKAATEREREIQLKMNVVKSSLYVNLAIACSNHYDSTGRKMNETTRVALRKANEGATRSETAKEKMKAAWAKRRLTPVSDKTRAKMKAARKNQPPMPDEVKAKIARGVKAYQTSLKEERWLR